MVVVWVPLTLTDHTTPGVLVGFHSDPHCIVVVGVLPGPLKVVREKLHTTVQTASTEEKEYVLYLSSLVGR